MSPQTYNLDIQSDHAVPVTWPGQQVTVTVTSGDIVYYGQTSQVSASNSDGSIAVGATQTLTSVQTWIRSNSASNIQVQVTPLPSSVVTSSSPVMLKDRGSQLTKNMVGAAVMSTPPTITQAASSQIANSVAYAANYAACRFSGGPIFGYSGNIAAALSVREPTRSDLTPVGRWTTGSWRISFDFDGSTFEFIVSALAAGKFRVWVNEQPHSATLVNWPSSTGSNAWIQVNMTSRAQRRITLEFEGDVPFKGLVAAKTDTIAPPSAASPRVLWVADSYALGIGATSPSFSYAIQAARMLGWADVWTQAAIASTGFLAVTGTYGKYADRLANDVIPYSPDVVVLQGSTNDKTNGGLGTIGPQVTNCIGQIQSALPQCHIVVTGVPYAAAPSAAQLSDDADVAAAAAAATNVVYVEPMSTTAPWFTGTGNTGATTGDGNADYYRTTDATHPSPAGHDFLARRMARAIADALGLAAS